MSSPSKSAPSHIDTARAGGLYRVAIVGASSLKGKEVAEVLDDRNFPSVDIKLLDDDETIGQLESVRDEINFIQRLRAEQFDNVNFTFFASDPECTERTGRLRVKLAALLSIFPMRWKTNRTLWCVRHGSTAS